MSPVPDLYAIREATEADLPDILEIYNERVLNSTCLFIYEPVTLENRLAWFKETKENNYPIIVAVDNATQKTIAYASLGAFRGKPAYNLSTEISVYIHPEHHRKGLGSVLVKEILCIAREMKFRSIIASITSENKASSAMFQKFGFKLAAVFHDVGYKFGRFLDCDFYEYIIHETTVSDPTKAPQFVPFPWGSYQYPTA